MIKRMTMMVIFSATAIATQAAKPAPLVFEAGHPSLQKWRLPDEIPYPKGNEPTPERVKLGKQLFFDPRLSGDGNMSCASCHNPLLGWSDQLATAKGAKSRVLGRASPTIFNTAFNRLHMWDGSARTLEEQALGPMQSVDEMNSSIPAVLEFLSSTPGYAKGFEKAYPGEDITTETLAKAIASYERTIISRNAPFDLWLKGDAEAMSPRQVAGFKLFVDPDKGNCAACHAAPNFTDDGFHNLGLASFGERDADLGRYELVPVGVLKGALKTPSLREIEKTAPYFHDGSAESLSEVIDHYVAGGVVKTNLSPNMKKLNLTEQEQAQILAFMKALSSPSRNFTLPQLPH